MAIKAETTFSLADQLFNVDSVTTLKDPTLPGNLPRHYKAACFLNSGQLIDRALTNRKFREHYKTLFVS